MKKEDKQLLLQDLCARLPYGVKFSFGCFNNNYEAKGVDLIVTDDGEWEYAVTAKGITPVEIKYIRYYLRPMSSMTEKEKECVQTFMDIVTDENYGDGYSPSAWDAMNGFVQYCDSHHLDHRGLIFRGLALEAPEGMY